jgi:TIGR03009 family protein
MMIARFGMAAACGAVVVMSGWPIAAQVGAPAPQSQYQQYQSQPNEPPQNQPQQNQTQQYQGQQIIPAPQQPAGAVQGPPQQNVGPQSAAPAQPPPPPFVLTPQQQADLDRALDEWERQSGQINKFQGNFKHWKYDPTFLPPKIGPNGQLVEQAIKYSEGVIKYSAPDKGLIEEKLTREVTDPGTPGQKMVERAYGEHWACDGKVLSALDHEKKEIHRTQLPKEMQGTFITEGPLPFAFGTKAAPLKARYFLRLITPPGDTNEVWLDIRPRFQKDLTNFVEVDVILRAKDMLPTAIQITHAEVKVPIMTEQGQKIVLGRQREVYQFDEASWFRWPNFLGGEFQPSALSMGLGWKVIDEKTSVDPPPPANNPQARRQWPVNGPARPY